MTEGRLKVVSIRLSRDEFLRLLDACAATGLRLGDLVRDAALAQAERVLRRERPKGQAQPDRGEEEVRSGG